MRIEKVAPGPDRVGRYTVSFENGSVMRLYRQTIEDFGIYAGKELDEQTYAQLETAAGEMSAKMRAVRIISASSVSKGDLRQRLVQKGEDPEQARQAVQWLSDMDLLDDRKTAEQVVSSCIRKGYGLARAKQALYEKRIPKEYWSDALEDYPDQQDAIVSFLRSRLGSSWDEKTLRKATDALIRRGHNYGNIRRALETLSIDNEFLEEA
ncbi:MAG: RecX family transcriptional regulator [Oscillospiraceae bacterium]|nr:RecX family transcriptional regulator [Oscillospiraceae bacterium]